MHPFHEFAARAMVDHHVAALRPDRRQVSRPGRRKIRVYNPQPQPERAA